MRKLNEIPIKAMIYTNIMHEGRVLYNSSYKGYEFYVVSYGTHPCCYILVDYNNPYFRVDYDYIDLDVHGGVTFASFDHSCINNRDHKWIIGWDYAHYGDRIGCSGKIYTKYGINHTYKTKELIRDCIKAIENMIEVISNG